MTQGRFFYEDNPWIIVEEEEISFIFHEKNLGLVLVVLLSALGLSKHACEIYMHISIQIYTFYVYIWKGV